MNSTKKMVAAMSVKEVIGWMLAFPESFNLMCRITRPGYIQRALDAAYDVLPDGKGTRAVGYVCRNNGAILCYGGNDAVGPALRLAYTMMPND